jgi:outer membrane receptor for ferrienterochelin and colicins
MYGPGAVGGVVNIIPREPRESEALGYVRAEDMDGVTNWSAGFSGSVSSQDKKSGFGFYGQNDHISEYDRNGDGFTDIGRRDLNAFGGRFVRHFGDDGKITLDYGHINEDRRGGDHLEKPPFKTEITEWIRSSRDAVSFAVNNRIGNSCDYNVSVSYANMNRKTYYGGGGDPNAYGLTDNPLWVMGGQLNHYLGKHTLSWGVQHTADHLQDNHPGYDRVVNQHYRNSGLFLQDDWMLSKPLALIVGARIDKHSELNDAIISPRMALKYSPNSVVTVRGSASTGFLAPQVFDEDLHILIAGGEGQVIRNSDDLKEERSQSYTLGVEFTPRLGDGNLLFELNGFHTNLDDAFVLTEAQDDPLTDQIEMTRINGGGAHVTGAEITGGYMQGRFEGQIGWIQQSAEYDEVQDFDTKNFFRLPEGSAVGKLYWRDPDLVNAFVGIRYQDKMYMPHYAGWIDDDVLEHVDSFFIVDASLSHRFWIDDDQLTLTLGVRNLTDDFQEDLDLGADRDAGYVYGPRNPRTWYTSLKYGF